MSPIVAIEAPSTPERKSGNRLWIISEEMSMKSEVSARPHTLKGNARRPPRGAGSDKGMGGNSVLFIDDKASRTLLSNGVVRFTDEPFDFRTTRNRCLVL